MRSNFSQQVQSVMTYYRNYYLIFPEVLSMLEKMQPEDRYRALQERVEGYDEKVFNLLWNCTSGQGAFGDIAWFDFLTKILNLLNPFERKAFFDEYKYSGVANLFNKILSSKQLSEVERVELMTKMQHFLRDNLTDKEIRDYCHEKNIGGETYYDAAKKSGNKKVIEMVYELTKGKPYNSHFSLSNLFHAKKPIEREFFQSKILRHEFSLGEISEGMAAGREILKHILDKHPGLKISVINEVIVAPPFSDLFLSDTQKREKLENEIFAIRCLASENGLLALGLGLITLEQAKTYAIEHYTLMSLLQDPNLALLQFFKSNEYVPQHQNFMMSIKSDYAFIALEEKLITCEQLSKVAFGESSGLDQIFTYYGIVALREKLIRFEDALTLGNVNIGGAMLETLFTPNGITALREGLYTVNDLLRVPGFLTLEKMLKDDVLQQRRHELSKLSASVANSY